MRNLSKSAAPVGARQAETSRPEPSVAEMSHRRTEMHLRTVDDLVAGGMGQEDAVWYIQMRNMVVHTFHDNPHAAFQSSDPGVEERYLRLDAQAKAIGGGEGGQKPEVFAFKTADRPTQDIVRVVEDALQRMRAGMDHYGDTPRCGQMLAAEGGRIAAIVGPGATEPVINRIAQIMALEPADRALVEQALALHVGRESARAA